MNQATYQEYLRRLSEEEPLKICRICIQEKKNLTASCNSEWTDIRTLYEHITKLEVAIEYPFFFCTDCINMLRKIGEFQDMLRLSEMFWKKYVIRIQEPSNNQQPKCERLFKIDDGHILEQIHFESFPQAADAAFVQDYNCVICEEEFSSKQAFEKHMKEHEKGYSCAHCGMSIKSKASIIVHLQQIHNEGVATNPYKSMCTKCNLELSSEENLRNHVQQYHGPEDETKCPECKKIFANLRKLKRHVANHRQKPYQCTQCEKSFRHQRFLDKHSAAHTTIRAYVCELCGLGLSSNNHLKRHIAGVHENKKVKKYRRSIDCTLCEVIFSNLTEARVHFFAKHTKAAWIEFRSLCCGSCYIRFESTVIRDEHYSLYQGNHDKSKNRTIIRGPKNLISWSQRKHPHECDVCKYSYKTIDSLEKHMKMHHKKPRPFKCEYCGSSHSLAIELRKHIQRAHTEDRPFSCTKCDYKCVTRTEFNNHNSKWHNSEK